MFSPADKKSISKVISAMLLMFRNPEMPVNAPRFILHVDGKEYDSWANIVNNEDKGKEIPSILIQNLSVK